MQSRARNEGDRPLLQRALSAAFVLLFMTFLAAQAATGFMRQIFAGAVYPRAMRAFDWILSTFFTGPFGEAGGAAVLMALGFVFAVLILRQGTRSGRA